MEVKNYKWAKPSPKEIFVGLCKWIQQKFDDMEDLSPTKAEAAMKLYKKTLVKFKEVINFTNTTDPMGQSDETDLSNPYSKASCLILYLYTMEFGDPPLYVEVNKVCRTMDKDYLETLGPFIQAFGSIASAADKNRDPRDKIPTGEMITKSIGGGKDYNFAGMFVAFRGA